MADARKVLSYRYVQGASSAPSLYDDEDEDEYYDDYDAETEEPLEEPLPPSSGHSPSGSSKTLQYASGSGHSPSGGSKTLQYAIASSSSRPPGLSTFDTITEAVNKLQSRYSSPFSSIPNVAPSQPTFREPTPPYDRPPSTSSTASSYTVETDYAAPIKISQARSTTRPSSQQPPSLPTIDSGEPLQWAALDFIEEQDDPFSDRPPSRQRATPSYPSQTHQRHPSNSSSGHDHARENSLPWGAIHPPRPPSQLSAASTRSAGSTHRGPSPVQSATPVPRQLQLPAPSQDSGVQPTVGLVSRPSSAQQLPYNPYNPFHSQALTPPTNRIVQRRSPAGPLTPIDHFRHDTEAYASGRNSLPAYTIPLSRSPTPALGDDNYEAVSMVNGHHTGTSLHADTHYTGTSQYTDAAEALDDGEDDAESTDGEEDEGKDEKSEKPKPKSKFQEYLAKARTQALLDPEPEEKDLQNIFADPRRVVFPIPKSTTLEDEVPATPVETRHFGPAPTGRVARRNKTTKHVPLTNGNLVLDLPVPPKLVLPRVGQPEVMKTRYTAVTCDPDDFEKSGHFLRQNQMSRRTELFICITMYNVSFPFHPT
jgi:chitin synthase